MVFGKLGVAVLWWYGFSPTSTHFSPYFNEPMLDIANTDAAKLRQEYEILMVSKSWCPDCHYMQKIWKDFGLEDRAHIVELDKIEDKDYALALENEFAAISGEHWVPTIFFRASDAIKTDRHFRQWEKDGVLAEELQKLTQV